MTAWLIVHTLSVALLAGLAALVGRVTRCGPALRHSLWLVVLLKLLTPPGLAWPWSLPSLPSRPTVAIPVEYEPVEPPLPLVGAVHPLILLERPSEPTGLEIVPDLAPPSPPQTDELSTAAVSPWPARIGHGAWAVWLAGALIVAGRHLARVWRWQQFAARGRPAPPEVARLVGELSARFGIRPVPAIVLRGLASPVVGGFGRARLWWPEGLERRLTPEGLRAVLLHELAHLRRRDHWVGWLLLAGGCAWWWHPLYWLVRRQVRLYAELACDAWVTGSLPAARRDYAEALLEVCQRFGRPAAPAPALGAGGDGRRDFQRRLIMIMRERTSFRLSRTALVAVGLLALVALPGWTVGQAPTPRAQPVPEPAPDVAPPPLQPQFQSQPTAAPDGAKTDATYLRALSFLESQQAQQANEATGTDRDKKLRDLEQKIEAMVKELHALRGQHAQPAPTTATAPIAVHTRTPASTGYQAAQTTTAAPSVAVRPMPGQPLTGPALYWLNANNVPGSSDVVVLNRASYKMPAAKAEALGAFLTQHVKASVVETKVDGDTLVVTTTPEAQRTIAAFVALVTGEKPGTPRPGVIGLAR